MNTGLITIYGALYTVSAGTCSQMVIFSAKLVALKKLDEAVITPDHQQQTKSNWLNIILTRTSSIMLLLCFCKFIMG